MEIKIPEVGESIHEAMIADWLKEDGAKVERDEVICELETDKINVEITAETSGTLHIEKPAGETLAIGTVIGRIEEGGEGAEDEQEEKKDKEEKEKKEEKEEKKGKKQEEEKEKEKEEEGQEKDEKKKEDGKKKEEEKDEEEKDESKQEQEEEQKAEQDKEAKQKKEKASPVNPAAARLAREKGVDLSDIIGQGRDGRVRLEDVMAAKAEKQADKQSPAKKPGGPAPEAGDDRPVEREPMSPLRQKIAQRLLKARQQTAMLTTFNEADLGHILDLRKKRQEQFKKRHGVKLGLMSFFVKACIEALKEYPAVNGRIDGNDIVYHNYYDIGIAVGTERGLVVPVLRNADQMSFAEIEQTIRELGEKAQNKKLTMADLEGGTFTISNGGIYGSMLSTPLLNTPQCGILGMHAIQDRAVVRDGEIVIRPMMYLALSYDHQLIDGREAVGFLKMVKDYIEDTEELLLDL